MFLGLLWAVPVLPRAYRYCPGVSSSRLEYFHDRQKFTLMEWPTSWSRHYLSPFPLIRTLTVGIKYVSVTKIWKVYCIRSYEHHSVVESFLFWIRLRITCVPTYGQLAELRDISLCEGYIELSGNCFKIFQFLFEVLEIKLALHYQGNAMSNLYRNTKISKQDDTIVRAWLLAAKWAILENGCMCQDIWNPPNTEKYFIRF